MGAMFMQIQLAVVFQNVPEGYIGFVDELPGVNPQGTTLEEARTNLQEAITVDRLNTGRSGRGDSDTLGLSASVSG
jgi:hypothetical protein